MEPAAKLGQMLVGLVALLAIVAIQLVLAGRVRGRHEDRIVALIFLAPALLGLAVVLGTVWAMRSPSGGVGRKRPAFWKAILAHLVR